MDKKAPYTSENMKFLKQRYGDDPCGFLIDVLNFRPLDSWQKDLAIQYHKGGEDIAIKAGTSVGKTWMLAALAIWDITLHYSVKIIVTSVTFRQLTEAYGATLRNLIANSCIEDWFEISQMFIQLKGLHENFISLRNWSVSGDHSRFQGIHADRVKLIADEVDAIEPGVLDAFSGNLQNKDSFMVLIGNPTTNSGTLAKIFKKQYDLYKLMTVTAFDSSYIQQSWIDKMALKYGEDGDQYKIRVMAEFPTSSTGAFIPERLTEEAFARSICTIDPTEERVAGLDIGHTNDKSVLTLRQGKVVLLVKQYTCDIDNLAGEVYKDITKLNIERLYVDSNGVGATTYTKLSKMSSIVYPVKFGALPATDKRASNRRTLYWFLLREWLKTGSFKADCMQWKDIIIEQASSLMFTYDDKGRYALEKKEVAKEKRGVTSPDFVDSLAYTCCKGESRKATKEDKPEPVHNADYIRKMFNRR